MEENTVDLVFGIQYWYVGMTPQDLEPETTVELLEMVFLRQLSLRETKLRWTTSKRKKKKTKILKVILKFRKCWFNLRMKWCSRWLFINYLFPYILIPLKLKGEQIW